jgi:hypothetical protein
MPDHDYATFIDEAGDPWIKRVFPIDVRGSSEWFILSAVVVSRQNEALIPEWIQEIAQKFTNSPNVGCIHFRKLSHHNKIVATEYLGNAKLRIFSIAANKVNMRQHQNNRAGLISQERGWFYQWMLRLLLERTTCWIRHKTTERKDSAATRIILAERGDITKEGINNYLYRLKIQHANNTLYLNHGHIDWAGVDLDRIQLASPQNIPGLQLADIVASAIFASLSRDNGCKPNLQYALNLAGRIARHPDTKLGQASGFGFKLMPSWKLANLSAAQKRLFQHFGYPIEWWPEKKKRVDYRETLPVNTPMARHQHRR